LSLTFYEYPKCSTCKKAKTFLANEKNLQVIDIKANPPKKEDLLTWMKQGNFTLKNFFNTSGNSYKALGLKGKVDMMSQEEAAELLASDGMLIKRPLLIDENNQLLAVGFKEVTYKELLASE